MKSPGLLSAVSALLLVGGCTDSDRRSNTDAGADAAPIGMDGMMTMDAGVEALIPGLLELTTNCTVASNGKYAPDSGDAATIDICRLNGAYFWQADLDVDCDGQMTSECNLGTDPYYQNQTSFTQSDGQPLIASALPFVVLPIPSSRFSFVDADIQPGAVVAVIYQGKLVFGVFGDEGPSSVIGEGSYAMANSLGIDPNPKTGGIDSGVTYFAFVGADAVADPIEDHQAATTRGQMLAATLLQSN